MVERASGDRKAKSEGLESLYRVVTCPVEAVALEYVSESRPVAVLLEADALYLEGPGILDRWRRASPFTRVIFVDSDGPWILLMEFSDSDSGHIMINPCVLAEFGSAVDELLRRGGTWQKEFEDGRMVGVAV